MSWNDPFKLISEITAIVTIAVFMIKLVRGVDRIVNFFKEINNTLKYAIKSNELVSKKLTLMFDGVDKFLKKFKMESKDIEDKRDKENNND